MPLAIPARSKDVGKGTGLGLSVAYRIVKQHDGLIRASSEPGKGTSFPICLLGNDVAKGGLLRPSVDEDVGRFGAGWAAPVTPVVWVSVANPNVPFLEWQNGAWRSSRGMARRALVCCVAGWKGASLQWLGQRFRSILARASKASFFTAVPKKEVTSWGSKTSTARIASREAGFSRILSKCRRYR